MVWSRFQNDPTGAGLKGPRQLREGQAGGPIRGQKPPQRQPMGRAGGTGGRVSPECESKNTYMYIVTYFTHV